MTPPDGTADLAPPERSRPILTLSRPVAPRPAAPAGPGALPGTDLALEAARLRQLQRRQAGEFLPPQPEALMSLLR